MNAAGRLGMAALTAALAAPIPLAAQLEVSGYLLGLGARSGESALGRSTNVVGRARLIAAATKNALQVDVAYEHVLTYNSRGGGFAITAPGGSAARDWLGTDWEVWSSDDADWRHRLDRLSMTYSGESYQVTVGRQAISWGTTLFLTPADPFSPFNPSDPFRVYRGGVDAVRVQAFPGPFSELEVVIRPTETAAGTTTTALARGQTSVGGWALGAWGGVLHDEAAGAAFVTGSLGATAVRTEWSIREDRSGAGTTLRGTLGFDRYFTPGGKTLLLLGEVQYDGFGAETPSSFPEVFMSDAFQRGEMQTLGAWAAAGQISYEIHPLVSVSALALVNLDDTSLLLAPGLAWSTTSSATIQFGLFTGAGDDATSMAPFGSEYGAIPWIGYTALTWYF